MRWEVKIDDRVRVIEYQGKKLRIDGKERKLKSNSLFVTMIDEAVTVGSKTLRLVVKGRKVDLAVDGYFLGTGKAYEPLLPIPSITWFFVVVNVLLGLFLAGIMGACVGIAGSAICLHTASAQNRSTAEKNVLNTVVSVVCLAANIAIFMMFGMKMI